MSTLSPWSFFTEEELRCRHCGQMKMNAAFMAKLVTLRRFCNIPFKVSSAYRCPEHNNAVSGTGRKGPHTTGQAIDIVCNSDEALMIVENARRLGMTGVGINQKGQYNQRFIHLDDLESDHILNRVRPHLWSY